jgi:hypothetical protein
MSDLEPIIMEPDGRVVYAIDWRAGRSGGWRIEHGVRFDPPIEWAAWAQLELFDGE